MELMVRTGGGEVWVRDSGGEGVPVVLLHPGWGDSGIWDEIADKLAEEVRVVRYDSLGYGESSAPTERYTALAELRAVLDQLDIQRAVLAGHSGGGATALSLALEEPDRVAELLLLAPGVSGYPWPADDPFFAGISAAAQTGDVEGAVGLGLRTWARAGAGESVETQIRSAVAGMERQAPFLDEDPPVYDRLGELDAPTTLLYGDLEYPMVADCCRAIAERIPTCRVVTLPGTDHMVPLRAAGVVTELAVMAVSAAEAEN
jgi:3-oxoadipate enol-lactonase